MTQEQLKRANFLASKIESIDDLLSAYKPNVRMVLGVYSNNTQDRSGSIEIERKHHLEIINLITKCRDDYKKELDEL